MRPLLFFALVAIPFVAGAQDFGFPFGRVLLKEVEMTTYPRDTSAAAVYLDEYGETFVDPADYNLIHRYHAKIKVLRTEGLSQADFMIPLHKWPDKVEKLRMVKAASYSIENGAMRSTPLAPENIFTEKVNKYWDLKKLAVPAVKVGSVIEIAYELETPYLFNFKEWEFQAEIPKVKSEYVAIIPAVYTYNIGLTGFLKLTKNESKVVKNCLTEGVPGAGGFAVDCSHFTYGMTNIPAFYEEDYMTSKKNFLSAIHFELAETHSVNGVIDKITKEWKDVDSELKKHQNFGSQLRKSRGLLEDEIAAEIGLEADPLAKATRVYNFIRKYFIWDGDEDKYSGSIKDAVEKKKGSAADINLMLTAALQNLKLDAWPVILSTRENGMVNDLYPVLSSFNYVIASVKIGDTIYLLDATDDFHPFGVLPQRCLNGKGRLLHEDGSYWVDLKPGDRARNLTMMNVRLDPDGMIRGTLRTTYMGYEAISFRKDYFGHNNPDEYLNSLKSKLQGVNITKIDVKGAEEFEKAVVRELEVEIESFGDASSILFNPQLLGRWKENPFKSKQRLYPVDFGAPLELTTILSIDFPADMELVTFPEDIGLSLPNAGGKFIVDGKRFENKVTLTNTLQLNRSVFSSDEYHYLRELFQRVVEVQNTDLLFRKKT